jgi:hypothetical protein
LNEDRMLGSVPDAFASTLILVANWLYLVQTYGIWSACCRNATALWRHFSL